MRQRLVVRPISPSITTRSDHRTSARVIKYLPRRIYLQQDPVRSSRFQRKWTRGISCIVTVESHEVVQVTKEKEKKSRKWIMKERGTFRYFSFYSSTYSIVSNELARAERDIRSIDSIIFLQFNISVRSCTLSRAYTRSTRSFTFPAQYRWSSLRSWLERLVIVLRIVAPIRTNIARSLIVSLRSRSSWMSRGTDSRPGDPWASSELCGRVFRELFLGMNRAVWAF